MTLHVIGLLGGVASGKSTVAEMFAEAGAGILDADRAGHQVLRLQEVERAARSRWGESVFGSDGRLDRGKIAQIVFAPPPTGPEERRFLEQLTHPKIASIIQQQIHTLTKGACPLAVLDAPLLLEAGWDRLCSTLVFVDVPRDVRLARALQRNWTPVEFEKREQAQLTAENKRARAHFVIENAGELEETRTQVKRIWQSLVDR